MIPKPAYIMSGPHLSGYRVILGYETLAEAHDAHDALAKTGNVPTPAMGTEPSSGAVNQARSALTGSAQG